ncbi:MAG: DUF106 domain-containing protein [Methanobacteriota archaeon]|nr:MAG: DUF106 domain-containing protein [Euryarchaeota archaeon]
MAVFEPFYGILDTLFHPVFSLFPGDQKLSLMTGIFVVSIIISLITTVVTVKVIDQDEMKRNKKKLKTYQERFTEATKKGDEKRAKKIQSEMMQVQSQVMKSSFAPMLYTFVPIIIVFRWLYQYAPLQTFILEKGYLVSLPFTLPRYGTELGWLGWYIICSLMTSTVIRKAFNLQM